MRCDGLSHPTGEAKYLLTTQPPTPQHASLFVSRSYRQPPPPLPAPSPPRQLKRKWVDAYARRGKEPIDNFVAIDDRALLQEWGGARLRGHFVQTSVRVGLTSRHVERAIAVLTDPPRQSGPREAARAAGKPSGPAQQLSMPFQKKPMGRTGQQVGRMAKPTELQSERVGRVGQGARNAQARRATGQGGRVGRPVKEVRSVQLARVARAGRS